MRHDSCQMYDLSNVTPAKRWACAADTAEVACQHMQQVLHVASG